MILAPLLPKYSIVLWAFILVCVLGCGNTYDFENKKPLLIAERSTLLDGMYLKLYDDRSFEVVIRRVREDHMYFGAYSIKDDTLILTYSQDSIVPEIGDRMILATDAVDLLNGDGELPYRMKDLERLGSL